MRRYIRLIINILVLALVIAQVIVGIYVLAKRDHKPVQQIKINQMQKSA